MNRAEGIVIGSPYVVGGIICLVRSLGFWPIALILVFYGVMLEVRK